MSKFLINCMGVSVYCHLNVLIQRISDPVKGRKTSNAHGPIGFLF